MTEVSPSSSAGGGAVSGYGGGWSTGFLIALPLGAVAILACMGFIIHRLRSEQGRRGDRTRKSVGGGGPMANGKDLSLTVPCLPPPPPTSSMQSNVESTPASMHHRLMLQQQQPASCMPYSVSLTQFFYTLFPFPSSQQHPFASIFVVSKERERSFGQSPFSDTSSQKSFKPYLLIVFDTDTVRSAVQWDGNMVYS